ncbi:ATP-binding cassette domain-containing protein [Streptomyces sp. NPDC050658]|uniref:ABC transporter ATP-binding protein n=1 Tax=unclassified Streptomyces TaxID=2593676 RepID=UPI003439735A
MIDIDGLVVRRGDTDVLSGVRLRVEDGEAVHITGANGSGKSTLLGVLAGLYDPAAGTVLIGGHRPGDRAARALLGHVQEPPPLYEHLTAHEQLALTAALWNVRTAHLVDRADALGLADRRDVLVGDLSLGQRKKLGFVCATAHDPRLLLLDEPFNGLDSAAESAVRDDLARWKAEGRTLVLVSHTAEAVAGLVDRTVRLGAGAGAVAPSRPDGERA